MDDAVRRWGLREYSGPFAFSAVAFGVAALALLVFMRPDPLLTARRLAASPSAGTSPPPAATSPPAGTSSPPAGTSSPPAGTSLPAETLPPPVSPGGGLRAGWRAVLANPAARLGMAAVAAGHLVMVAVMSMTPVHIGSGTADHAAVLRVVGIVLSLHIAGMYALSPVMGWLTDRLGRRPVILIGIGLLVTACGFAGTAGHDTVRLSVGLFLLGLGWSATMVAGSTLLSESVDAGVRPAAQGLNDLVMGLAGASAGALSGFVVYLGGYATLALLSAIATLPLLALALRPVPMPAR
jgi:hypothetical protein